MNDSDDPRATSNETLIKALLIHTPPVDPSIRAQVIHTPPVSPSLSVSVGADVSGGATSNEGGGSSTGSAPGQTAGE